GTKASNEFAARHNAIDKIIVSQTLKNADGNTKIISDNLEAEIIKLKQEPGKKISIGGVSLRSQLMALGLVDEYYFVIHPIIAGKGKHLLEDITLQENINLKLADVKVFKSGCVGLYYLKG
ncbi:MAG: deaminase, partial [Acinetobacter sp.]